MKSIKEVSVESKILKRLQDYPKCLELVNYLFNDAELITNSIEDMLEEVEEIDEIEEIEEVEELEEL